MSLTSEMKLLMKRQSFRLINSIISDLNASRKNATGDLAKSLQSVPQGLGFDLLGNDYWKFVDQGVQGHGRLDGYSSQNSTSDFRFKKDFISISAIKEWAMSKGINPFALSRTIASKGIKASDIFTNNINRFEKNLGDLDTSLNIIFEREIDLIIKLK